MAADLGPLMAHRSLWT